ncbi:MAG: hypothetical protein A3C50_00135 [Candidatus Staskawiczbacteria bacterium RIFCSPHIGHO2_02_FULL_43_16]|uniref:DNA topoisomerase type IA zn finger domain-containing protein n=1 Tax=Candidatus Staskawiczbacteria bacterium RIFCSPHIGHO2_01_FULL_41_41 TaxID=1802203 RepID=A0A1G2HVG3_9BACT|nr:MAG: hypothetical protein A2822_01800 [Candidatus Staskawiczbacteria bacterium RIFCSPHIGHO2_01_FULL_41_41]OGZ68902.1 MAG: hypothetical protein A3C50_00135 [Candidatus Staskawiczbacteria bacterium RIFCSPHIGHO2_02_FULL_43_16]OGZ74916.1 MAG: hypothetical protein A3A12_03680 [Candidatus Staskawiczbacteria bacterium RIFCSPLOWO2_01_FULL_43_17b]
MFDPNNRVHVNYSVDRASDGTIIRSSIMVNLYEESVEGAVKLYREIKEQIEVVEKSMGGQVNPKEVMAFPECPDHKVKMLMRTRRADAGIFFGCPHFGSSGCSKTLQYPVIPKADVR